MIRFKAGITKGSEFRCCRNINFRFGEKGLGILTVVASIYGNIFWCFWLSECNRSFEKNVSNDFLLDYLHY